MREPAFGLHVLVRFGLALGIEFQLETPAPIAFRFWIRQGAIDLDVLLENIQRAIQQRPQHMGAEGFAEGLIGIERRRFGGGRTRVEDQNREQRREDGDNHRPCHSVMVSDEIPTVKRRAGTNLALTRPAEYDRRYGIP
jgi:hypothetical protein